MTQRPKIWIHRTRRFWIGLIILLGLLVTWILSFTIYQSIEIRRVSKGAAGSRIQDLRIGINSSDLAATYYDETYDPSPFSGPTTGWSFEVNPRAFRFAYATIRGAKVITIPIGGIVIFWAAAWIIWMFIAERRELRRYSKELESDKAQSLTDPSPKP